MKSKELWECLNGKYVLVFSSNSFIMNQNPYTIDFFIDLNRSYIGSNQIKLWDELKNENINTQYNNFNGGLSLRKRSDMIKIINKFNNINYNYFYKYYTDFNEDLFFTLGCFILNLPIGDDENCRHFSCHQIIDYCFGAYKLNEGYYLNLIQKYKNICDNIYLFKNMNDIENENLVLHPGGGFFSNCTVRLFEIILYFETKYILFILLYLRKKLYAY